MNNLLELTAEEISNRCNELIDLLCDSVDSGASIGFLPPVSQTEATEYWSTVAEAIRTSYRILIVAFLDGKVAGAVQLALEAKANGNHRAEVMKLMVHRGARRKGIGEALMRHVEEVARRHGRSLIVLDTRFGLDDAAEKLYDSSATVRPALSRVMPEAPQAHSTTRFLCTGSSSRELGSALLSKGRYSFLEVRRFKGAFSKLCRHRSGCHRIQTDSFLNELESQPNSFGTRLR